jgi:GNAT superfamily N-acetyltransferase
MKLEEIENIELSYLNLRDYQELKQTMILAYDTMPDEYWEEDHIKILISKFPEGQVVIKINDKIAGCALSIILDYGGLSEQHTYREITSNFTFDSHTDEGDILYGIDVFILPQFRGLRLGRRLYDYRKELCEKRNLRGIAFGGRLPNYNN